MPYTTKYSNDGELYICAMHEPLKVSEQDLTKNSIRQTSTEGSKMLDLYITELNHLMFKQRFKKVKKHYVISNDKYGTTIFEGFLNGSYILNAMARTWINHCVSNAWDDTWDIGCREAQTKAIQQDLDPLVEHFESLFEEFLDDINARYLDSNFDIKKAISLREFVLTLYEKK